MKRFLALGLMTLLTQWGTARAQDNTLSEVEKREGYSLLFDGTLASFKAEWVDYIKGNSTNTNLNAKWTLDATNKCISLPSGNTTDIRSVKQYKDFELRLNYRIDGNQGIVYRGLLTYDFLWQTGVEYAINNVTNLGKDNPGAAYDIFAPPNPLPYNLFSTNLWNSARIVVKGDSVEHWSNGTKVVGYKYHSTAFWVAYNQSKWHPDDVLTNKVAKTQNVGTGYIEEGYLGLQGDHGGRWQIKDLKVTVTPCFGPIKTDGSVCPVTSIEGDSKTKRVEFSVIRQGLGNLQLNFGSVQVKRASILGLDGKIQSHGVISGAQNRVTFATADKPGLYFLRLELESGIVTQKINLL